MVCSEVFVEFYTGGSHTSSARYLYFGLHEHNALVPWIWSSVVMTVIAALIMLRPGIQERRWLLNTACVLAFVGIWIEKGMGLIIPGFVPSTLHEVMEYLPNLLEWKIMAGIWAFGLMIYTIALKATISVLTKQGLRSSQ